jgi:hypothetical protein
MLAKYLFVVNAPLPATLRVSVCVLPHASLPVNCTVPADEKLVTKQDNRKANASQGLTCVAKDPAKGADAAGFRVRLPAMSAS